VGAHANRCSDHTVPLFDREKLVQVAPLIIYLS
jgi:hypothetical protein